MDKHAANRGDGMSNPPVEIFRFDTAEECHTAIGHVLQDLIQTTVARQGYFTVALSGGTTPAALFQTLCRPPFSSSIPWSKVFFFWGDERFVPSDHTHSNFRMAQQNLLSCLPIADDHIFRMPSEIRPYAQAAYQYQQTLAQAFSALTSRKVPYAKGEYPSFDLVLLGMGHDAHTASLFAGHPALKRRDWVAEVDADHASPPVARLTLTLPLINNAGTALFLIRGTPKVTLAESFLACQPQAHYPASLIRPRQRLLWYLAP